MKKETIKTSPYSNEPKERPQKKSIKQKLLDIFDQFIFLVSLFISLIIMYQIEKLNIYTDWPLFLDRILLFILIFFIIESIIHLVRPLLMIITSLLVIFLIVFLVQHNQSDTTVTTTNNTTIINRTSQAIFKTLNLDYWSLEIKENTDKIDSLNVEIETLKNSIDSLCTIIENDTLE